MAYLATKRLNYWGQLGVLTLFIGVGLLIGGILSLIPLMGIMSFKELTNMGSGQLMDNLLKAENANALRLMNSISTVCLFFFPALLYAFICHKKALLHLGFKKVINWQSVGVIFLIMMAALPLVSILQELTEKLPWSQAMLQKFKKAEDDYTRQVMVMARMDNFTDYLLSIFVIAFLPAVFEETLFRGGVQNLLARWFKKPVVGIVLTAIIFSAIHGSYLGFLSRFMLGFILGWIFHRTGNLWLSIAAHFFNNAFAVTAMYVTTKPGETPDPTKLDESIPIWAALLSVVVTIALFALFDKVSKPEVDRPGEEVPMPGVAYTNDPFYTERTPADTPAQN